MLGVCYDEKSSFLKGAAQAPSLIRKALFSPSANYYTEQLIEIRPDMIKDLGDFIPAEYFEIRDIVSNQGDMPLLTLGGDHSITYPIIQAYAKQHGTFEILQIDAHGDLYENYEGDPYSHACPFSRIMEERLVNRLTQVGIRTLTPHLKAQAEKYKVIIHEMQSLELKSVKLNGPVYISLDLDALDPAFAPGVSHHEPGGMTTRQVLDLIQQIEVPVIGADIVEYNPSRDLHAMTAALAGKLAKEIIAKMI